MKRWINFIGGKMWLDPEASEFEALMAAGRWEHRKVALLQKYLKPGMVFVDAGAHWGYFSLIAAKLGARVIAIEPASENHQRLITNFEMNDYPLEAHLNALWSYDNRRDIYHGYNSGTHSLVRDYEGVLEIVHAVTLDSILLGRLPDVVKIDVEGADPEMITGAGDTLTRATNMVILMDLHPELGVHNEGIGGWLCAHGFRLYDIRSDNAPIETIPPTMVELLAIKGSM